MTYSKKINEIIKAYFLKEKRFNEPCEPGLYHIYILDFRIDPDSFRGRFVGVSYLGKIEKRFGSRGGYQVPKYLVKTDYWDQWPYYPRSRHIFNKHEFWLTEKEHALELFGED